MGRAFEVRKASIYKKGAIKSKLYVNYAKTIYLAAKKGTPNIENNLNLKRLVDKAKKDQVPNDLINRAIEKARCSSGDDYHEVTYEGFGPGESTFIIKCLTDNVNRTVSLIRSSFNKFNKNLGVTNSVSYNYDYLAIISFKSKEADKILDILINEGLDIIDFEIENDEIIITSNPKDISLIKDIIDKMISNLEYDLDEIGWYPKKRLVLSKEDQIAFMKLYDLLDSIEDITEIYHNVE